MAQVVVKKGINMARLWYRVEIYTNLDSDSRYALCCGCSHIENKSGGRIRYGKSSGYY